MYDATTVQKGDESEKVVEFRVEEYFQTQCDIHRIDFLQLLSQQDHIAYQMCPFPRNPVQLPVQ